VKEKLCQIIKIFSKNYEQISEVITNTLKITQNIDNINGLFELHDLDENILELITDNEKISDKLLKESENNKK